MKKTAILIFALYANSIYTDEYIFFESTEALYNEVEKRSAKIGAFIRKHDLRHLESKSPQLIHDIHELIRISEHELKNYPMLKKRFLSDLWLDLAIGRFEAKDFTQAEYFCDLAIVADPENPLPYPQKACFSRRTGHETQALTYEKIAIEKGIDRCLLEYDGRKIYIEKYIFLAKVLSHCAVLAQHDVLADGTLKKVCAIMDKLYIAQEGLMSRTSFLDCIIPFIGEAANSLSSIRYMLHNSDMVSSINYFDQLLEYQNRNFYYLINPTSHNLSKVCLCALNLELALKQLTHEPDIEYFDVFSERMAVIDLIKRAQKKYYESLDPEVKSELSNWLED